MHMLYLPFQHAKPLHGLVLVCVCIQSYKWVLGIQRPSFSESCVISFFVQPSQSITAVIMEMLNSSLNLQTTEMRHATKDLTFDKKAYYMYVASSVSGQDEPCYAL